MRKLSVLMVFILTFILTGCGANIDDQQLLSDAISNMEYIGNISLEQTASVGDQNFNLSDYIEIQDFNNVSMLLSDGTDKTIEFFKENGEMYFGVAGEYYKMAGTKLQDIYQNIVETASNGLTLIENGAEVIGENTTLNVDGEEMDVRKIMVNFTNENLANLSGIDINNYPIFESIKGMGEEAVQGVNGQITYYVDTANQTLLNVEESLMLDINSLGEVKFENIIDYTDAGSTISIDFPKELTDAKTYTDGAQELIDNVMATLNTIFGIEN